MFNPLSVTRRLRRKVRRALRRTKENSGKIGELQEGIREIQEELLPGPSEVLPTGIYFLENPNDPGSDPDEDELAFPLPSFYIDPNHIFYQWGQRSPATVQPIRVKDTNQYVINGYKYDFDPNNDTLIASRYFPIDPTIPLFRFVGGAKGARGSTSEEAQGVFKKGGSIGENRACSNGGDFKFRGSGTIISCFPGSTFTAVVHELPSDTNIVTYSVTYVGDGGDRPVSVTYTTWASAGINKDGQMTYSCLVRRNHARDEILGVSLWFPFSPLDSSIVTDEDVLPDLWLSMNGEATALGIHPPKLPVAASLTALPKTFHTWCDSFVTTVPIEYPTTFDQLKALLNAQKKLTDGKIRVTGSTHSSAAIVTDGISKDGIINPNQLVISLTNYVPDGWDGTHVVKCSGGNCTIKAPAGWSYLDLYQQIRPDCYFLPTQTAAFFFTLGGTVNGPSVHGGGISPDSKSRDLLSRYVSSLLVAVWDGNDFVQQTITKTSPENEWPYGLRYWRNSYGLLGIILGVEFEQLQHRANFWMKSKSTSIEWTQEGLQKHWDKLLGKYVIAEIFFNFRTEDPPEEGDMVSITNVVCEVSSDWVPLWKECNINKSLYGTWYNTYQLSWDPESSTRGALPLTFPNLNKDIKNGGESSNDQSEVDGVIDIVENGLPLLMFGSRSQTNDGFFPREVPCTDFMAYFCPIEYMFEFLNILREEWVYRWQGQDQQLYPGWRFNLPAEARFVTSEPKAPYLYNLPEGEYVTSECLSITGGDDWAYQEQLNISMEAIEKRWRTIPYTGEHVNVTSDYTLRIGDDKFLAGKYEDMWIANRENSASDPYANETQPAYMSFKTNSETIIKDTESITVNVEAYDVDEPNPTNVYICNSDPGDMTVENKTLLGPLIGENNEWTITPFKLTPEQITDHLINKTHVYILIVMDGSIGTFSDAWWMKIKHMEISNPKYLAKDRRPLGIVKTYPHTGKRFGFGKNIDASSDHTLTIPGWAPFLDGTYEDMWVANRENNWKGGSPYANETNPAYMSFTINNSETIKDTASITVNVGAYDVDEPTGHPINVYIYTGDPENPDSGIKTLLGPLIGKNNESSITPFKLTPGQITKHVIGQNTVYILIAMDGSIGSFEDAWWMKIESIKIPVEVVPFNERFFSLEQYFDSPEQKQAIVDFRTARTVCDPSDLFFCAQSSWLLN